MATKQVSVSSTAKGMAIDTGVAFGTLAVAKGFVGHSLAAAGATSAAVNSIAGAAIGLAGGVMGLALIFGFFERSAKLMMS